MKRTVFFIALACVGVFAVSANPFVGKWQVIMAFSQETIVFDFKDDGTYIARQMGAPSSSSLSPVAYVLDEVSHTIDLGMVESLHVIADYSFPTPDTFQLMFPKTVSDELSQQISESMGIPAGANHLTRGLRDRMVGAIRAAVEGSVFIEGTRTKASDQ